ncbi:hypothetical protein LTR17_002834 [Elasticomyces elasticus]|nr:hypothetical protein LTR17_002834 [Elasticomyces elasticus]
MASPSAPCELSLASLTLTQHDQDSTAHTVQSESTKIDDKQSAADDSTTSLLQAQEALPDVVFKCAECRFHFKTEKLLQKHVRFSPAHATGSSSANTNGRRSENNPQRFRTQADRQDSPAFTAFNGVDRNFVSDQILPDLPTSPGHTIQPKIPVIADLYDMRPDLHDDVLHLLEPYRLSFDFFTTDNPQGQLKEYDTSIMVRVPLRLGRAGRSPLPYGCTKEGNTMPGYTTRVVNAAKSSTGQSWTARTQTESRIVWRSGPVSLYQALITHTRTRLRTKQVYAKVGRSGAVSKTTIELDIPDIRNCPNGSDCRTKAE